MASEELPNFDVTVTKKEISRLFVQKKEYDFMNKVASEFLQSIGGQFVLFYSVDTQKTKTNSYGESKEKIIKGGKKVKLPARVGEVVTPINDEFGIRYKKKLRVSFLQKLNEVYGVNDVFNGDFLEWQQKQYEIVSTDRVRKLYGQEEFVFEIVCECEARGEYMPNLNNDKSHDKISLQLEELNKAIISHFNEKHPFIIDYPGKGKQPLPVIYNVGETWKQVEQIQKRQQGGDYIPQKPIITLRSVGIEPIKEWNRLPKHLIKLDKQLYKDRRSKSKDYYPKNGVPVFEYTYMRYPTHYRRLYRLSIWTDYMEDQDNIIETVMATLLSSNSIIIRGDGYNTIGYLQSIVDENNFSNRSSDLRELKNYIDFEFEGYLIRPDSIVKKRSFSHIRITEEIVKN